MKVVVAHNLYRSAVPSGENRVVRDEIVRLRDAGVEVVPLLEDSDDIPRLGLARRAAVATGPVINPYGVRRLRTMLQLHRPDVLHLHNVYPLLSPWVVQVARQEGVPVVQTVHNFRHDCVAGTYFRDGAPCTSCSGHAMALPALQHGCYRGSRLQSVPMVIGRTVHRRTWLGLDRYLVLTEFHREMLVAQGVPADRVVLRPTCVDDPGPATPPGRDLLYVGRLSAEKGIAVLLDAWSRSDARTSRRLVVAGDGPLADDVRRAAASDPTITYEGQLPPEQVSAAIRAAGVVAVPSRWFEGFPHVIVEALAHGRMAMVSTLGGTAATAGSDAVTAVAPTAAAWVAALDALDDDRIVRQGTAARRRFLEGFESTQSTERLLETYRELTRSREVVA